MSIYLEEELNKCVRDIDSQWEVFSRYLKAAVDDCRPTRRVRRRGMNI